jgi:hypothetical protein
MSQSVGALVHSSTTEISDEDNQKWLLRVVDFKKKLVR